MHTLPKQFSDTGSAPAVAQAAAPKAASVAAAPSVSPLGA